jgi:lipopolysaccharide/colanic/teichoic acid biosynthesis glycosyltransferase
MPNSRFIERAPRWKRALDLVLVIVSLPFLLPVILLTCLWIKMVSRGPALFRQQRIGKDGRPFTLYKFRSMKADAPPSPHVQHVRRLLENDQPLTKLDLLGDERVIAGGSFLRNTGLDELPQLINVVRGEMSLVGPRPCLPEEYDFFTGEQRQRFRVLPGLTGYWQVNGKNSTTFREMGAMDLHYSDRASLWLDLSIMVRTPPVLMLQMHRYLVRRALERRLSRGPAGGHTKRRPGGSAAIKPLLATGGPIRAHRSHSFVRRK